jgi:colanic acid/amylovoran biosynthesis glycosyltransferase
MPANDPVLCVIAPDKDIYSETFIHAHVRSLYPAAEFLYGDGAAFPTKRMDGSLLLPGNFLAKFIRELSQKVFRSPAGHFETRALIGFLKRRKVEVVLAEYGPTGAAVMDACETAGVRLLVHFHGYDAYDVETLSLMKEGYPRLFQKASAVIAVSRHMEKQLLSLGVPPEKLFYNSYGIDVSFFQGSDPASAGPHFLAVGRLVDKKAPYLTLLAFHKVRASFPEARLSFVGNGPLKEASQQLAAALGLGDAVEFLGVQGPNEILSLMKRSRAFVQHSLRTSYGDSEGTPVGILEAAAAGLPVVSTLHAGIPDVITEGQSGFLVPEKDFNAMADRMGRLAQDPALAKRLGEAGRKKVFSDYSREKSFEGLRKIIRQCALEGRA